jgi:hypothetical protein
MFGFWCGLYMTFVPQPDITAYELAYICSRNGCEHSFCITQEKYDALPENIKRHFKQEN